MFVHPTNLLSQTYCMEQVKLLLVSVDITVTSVNEALERTLVLHLERTVKSSASIFSHWHCHKDSLCGSMMVTPEAYSIFLDAQITVKNRIIEVVPVSQC